MKCSWMQLSLTEQICVRFMVLWTLGSTLLQSRRRSKGTMVLYLFQPFKGQWVQTLGAFLSSAAVPGYILRNIILEAVVLMHNQGFTVDIVTTDGAKWNRAMWKLSGVSLQSSSCEHPANKDQRLWFASDFPHLVKTIWKRVVSRKELSVSGYHFLLFVLWEHNWNNHCLLPFLPLCSCQMELSRYHIGRLS